MRWVGCFSEKLDKKVPGTRGGSQKLDKEVPDTKFVPKSPIFGTFHHQNFVNFPIFAK